MYKTKHYNIDIWGDGEKEYLGYYMIIINKFDINNNWIGKNIVYIKQDKMVLLDKIYDESWLDILWKAKMYSIV